MQTTHRSTIKWMGLLPLFLLAAVSAASAQSTWFPLEPGLHWIYSSESGFGGKQTVSVVRQEGEQFFLDYSGTEVVLNRIRDNGDVDVVLPDEGPGVFYRFDTDSWLHRDYRTCDDLLVLTVTSRDETVQTPAGEFTGCLKIEFEPGPCVDGGTYVQWWAPDVGLVRWAEGSFTGERVFALQEFSHGDPVPTFRRGDTDSNGTVDLSDAINVLTWLFLDGSAPSCQDAADANDDGTMDLSDPITVLVYLYAGGGGLPAPGPDTCGADPTEDGLPACEGGCRPTRFAGD